MREPSWKDSRGNVRGHSLSYSWASRGDRTIVRTQEYFVLGDGRSQHLRQLLKPLLPSLRQAGLAHVSATLGRPRSLRFVSLRMCFAWSRLGCSRQRELGIYWLYHNISSPTVLGKRDRESILVLSIENGVKYLFFF